MENIKKIIEHPVKDILEYIYNNKENEKKVLDLLKLKDRFKYIKVSNDLRSVDLNPRGAAAARRELIEAVKNRDPVELTVSSIRPNPAQPRKYWHSGKLKELSDSIKEHGLLQPIVVNKESDGSFTLIAGERRLRAHEMAGIEKINAVILEINEHESRKLALIENIQRADLLPLEEGIGFKNLMDEGGYSIRDLEEIIQKKRTYIHDRVSLTKFSPENIDFIFKNEITSITSLLKILSTDENVHTSLLEKLAAGTLTDQDINMHKTPTRNPENHLVNIKERLGLDSNETMQKEDHQKAETNQNITAQQTEATKDEESSVETNLRESNSAEADSISQDTNTVEPSYQDVSTNDEILTATNAIRISGNRKEIVNIRIDVKNITGSDIEAIREFLSSI